MTKYYSAVSPVCKKAGTYGPTGLQLPHEPPTQDQPGHLWARYARPFRFGNPKRKRGFPICQIRKLLPPEQLTGKRNSAVLSGSSRIQLDLESGVRIDFEIFCYHSDLE